MKLLELGVYHPKAVMEPYLEIHFVKLLLVDLSGGHCLVKVSTSDQRVTWMPFESMFDAVLLSHLLKEHEGENEEIRKYVKHLLLLLTSCIVA
ncbi:hypothetical protein Tco_0861692 [Tanacetum coccineum]|uniref:Uncharacterized protein n=1 Tax=Tanacetum coccineum TaxID=301880 RepID=A0ABQ5BIJ7_9ASTR